MTNKEKLKLSVMSDEMEKDQMEVRRKMEKNVEEGAPQHSRHHCRSRPKKHFSVVAG